MNSFLSLKKYLGLPVDVSAQGGGIDNLIFWVHVLMGALFVGWLCYFIAALIMFNKRANPKASYVGMKNHVSTYAEITVAIIEGVLLIGLAIPLWAHAVDQFPDPKKSVQIKVIAQQFNWSGLYPGTNGVFAAQDASLVTSDNPLGLNKKDPNFKSNFTVTGTLEVPVDRDVLVYITSKDVIHCFAVRPLRVTQDAIPGMSFPAWFHAKVEGLYAINCAQLCGIGHYGMRGNIKVVSQKEFDDWVAKKTSGGGASASYE